MAKKKTGYVKAMRKRQIAIRTLNDEFRRKMTTEDVTFYAEANELSPTDKTAVLEKIKSFSKFTKHNDRWGEHSIFRVTYAGRRYYAQIETFDLQGKYASQDPANPAKSRRRMIITVVRSD